MVNKSNNSVNKSNNRGNSTNILKNLDKNLDKNITHDIIKDKDNEIELRWKLKDKGLYYFILNYLSKSNDNKFIRDYEYLFDKKKINNKNADYKIIDRNSNKYKKEKTVVFRKTIGDALLAIDKESEQKINGNKVNNVSVNSILQKSIGMRYKERITRRDPSFPNWRFDFTKSAMGSGRNDLNKKIRDKNFDFQIEAEYIGDRGKNSVSGLLTDIGKIFNWFIELKTLYYIQKVLGLRNKTSIIQITNNPVPLTVYNAKNIEKDYVVTEKADGERVLLYFDKGGRAFAIFKPFEMKLIGQNSNFGQIRQVGQSSRNNNLRDYLFDAEYVDQINTYLVFDILIEKGENVTNDNFQKRYDKITKYFPLNTSNTKNTKNTNTKTPKIRSKEFLGFKEDIFKAAEKVYKRKYPYYVDGLIYNPINAGYYDSKIYKWKPVEDLTIDFLIRDKETKAGKKEVYLFVNISNRVFQREKYKLDTTYKKLFPYIKETDPNLPYYFVPSPIAKIPIKTKTIKGNKINMAGDIPLQDNTIVEFSYKDDPKIPEEERWIPYRLRMDKTKDYMEDMKAGKYSGQRGPNGMMTAVINLDSIKNPVTEDMVFGKTPLPELSDKKYYNVAKTEDDINLYHFNNLMIKSYLYDTYVKPGDVLLELSGGRGGDIGKIIKRNAGYVLFTNIDPEALKEAEERYGKMDSGGKIKFMELDLLNSAGLNKVEKYLSNSGKKGNKGSNSTNIFDVISCQFALHYAMKDKKTIDNLKKMVDALLKKGGIFMFTGLDGKKVYTEFETKGGRKLEYKYEGKPFAEIEKKYTGKFADYGQKINVLIGKIGIWHEEYLINYDYIIKVFNNYEIVEDTNFGEKIKDYRKPLSPDEKEYIRLHRYLVLRKK